MDNRLLRAVIAIGAASGLALLGLCLALWAVSRGTTTPFLDARGAVLPGSVASLEQVRLGGLEQFVLIRGRDRTQPVLLVLHGGPGDAEASLFRYYNRDLEDHFVVVHWDQRGAGRSYSADIPAESMTVEQLVADALELTDLLRARFDVDRIFVIGHSWGSYLGLRLVHEHPQVFSAFVGIGQVADQPESERRSFDWALAEARRRGDADAIRELGEVGPPSQGRYRGGLRGLGVQRKWVREYGGAAVARGNLAALWMFAWPTVVFREYRLRDKLQYLEAEAFSMDHLEEPMLDDPPAERMLDFDLPIFVFQGRHDHQTEFEVTRGYFEALRAPHKEMLVFENAAHLVPFEEPEAFLRAMVDRVLPWAQPDRSSRAAPQARWRSKKASIRRQLSRAAASS